MPQPAVSQHLLGSLPVCGCVATVVTSMQGSAAAALVLHGGKPFVGKHIRLGDGDLVVGK